MGNRQPTRQGESLRKPENVHEARSPAFCYDPEKAAAPQGSLRIQDIGMNIQASTEVSTELTRTELTMKDAPSAFSVLFASVAGNARLHEKLGSAEALRAVDRCLKRMERAVTAFGGRNVRTVGNELMAFFAGADEAYYAAIEMQARVADLPPVSGVELAIRIGFSHGVLAGDADIFRGDAASEAMYLAGTARPGQILTSLQARTALSPLLKKATHDLGASTATGKLKGMRIFEATTPEPLELTDRAASNDGLASADQRTGTGLRLRYGDQLVVLDDAKREITMGRDADSDVIIHDRRASRHHARIELRNNAVTLIDLSANGTYVTFSGKPELFLRREECVLHERGLICFAASSSSAEADFADFELT